jgi:hypothetical protein
MILSIIAGFYSVDSKIRRISGKAELSDLQARLLVRSVLLYVALQLNVTKKYFTENQVDNLKISDNLLLPDGAVKTINISDNEIEFKLEDERGKVDINNTPEQVLKEIIRKFYMLKGLNDSQKNADILVDSLLDWKDGDDNPRDNGAESEFYLKSDIPYSAANRPFKILEELLLVRGMTRDLYYGDAFNNNSEILLYSSTGLKDILTVYNFQGKVIKSLAPSILSEIMENSEKIAEESGAGQGALKYFDSLKLSVYIGNREYQVFFRYAEPLSNIKILRWIENPPQSVN